MLIECIETLGKESNDSCAELIIEEFDENEFDYDIFAHEYGIESLVLIPKVSRNRIVTFVEKGDLTGLLDYLKAKEVNLSD